MVRHHILSSKEGWRPLLHERQNKQCPYCAACMPRYQAERAERAREITFNACLCVRVLILPQWFRSGRTFQGSLLPEQVSYFQADTFSRLSLKTLSMAQTVCFKMFRQMHHIEPDTSTMVQTVCVKRTEC